MHLATDKLMFFCSSWAIHPYLRFLLKKYSKLWIKKDKRETRTQYKYSNIKAVKKA